MASIPWQKIKTEWLRGGTTYKKLAEKYGVKEGTIRNRASNEAWKKEKGLIRDKIMTETRGRIVRARVTHLEKLITANEALLDGLVQMAAAIGADPDILKDKTGSIRNAESFAKALQTATMTQRDLYRLPNIDQKLAAKKWAAEQKEKKAQAKEISGTVWNVVTEDGEPLDE